MPKTIKVILERRKYDYDPGYIYFAESVKYKVTLGIPNLDWEQIGKPEKILMSIYAITAP